MNKVKRLCVQTEGVNLQAAWAHSDWLDVNNLDTNDIGAMLR